MCGAMREHLWAAQIDLGGFTCPGTKFTRTHIPRLTHYFFFYHWCIQSRCQYSFDECRWLCKRNTDTPICLSLVRPILVLRCQTIRSVIKPLLAVLCDVYNAVIVSDISQTWWWRSNIIIITSMLTTFLMWSSHFWQCWQYCLYLISSGSEVFKYQFYQSIWNSIQILSSFKYLNTFDCMIVYKLGLLLVEKY